MNMTTGKLMHEIGSMHTYRLWAYKEDFCNLVRRIALRNHRGDFIFSRRQVVDCIFSVFPVTEQLTQYGLRN